MNMQPKRYFVTGAGGFVGKNLVSQLIKEGHTVHGLVRTSEQANIVSKLGAIPFLGDILDSDSLINGMKGCDGVFHIAALFRKARDPRSKYFEVNVDGTRNVFEAAKSLNIRKIVHCSTVGVHGHIETPPADEDYPFSPGDDYQDSKLAGEELARSYFKSGMFEGAIVRPGMVWGPEDERTLKLFKLIAEGKFFYVGPCDAHVHFVDVRDLAKGFSLAIDQKGEPGRTFIIGGESSLPLKHLVSIISSLLGVKEPKLHLPILPIQLVGAFVEALCIPFKINPPIYRRRVDFFTKQRWFNIDRAKNELGYSPSQNLIHEPLDIIKSYVQLGWLEVPESRRPSIILRCISGEIQEWDNLAEGAYGWSKQQAVGEVSHNLLRTRFPDSLDEINKKLLSFSKWTGVLRHKKSDGTELSVESRWNMVPAANGTPIVLETNLPMFLSNRLNTERVGTSFATVGLLWSRLAPLFEDLAPALCFA